MESPFVIVDLDRTPSREPDAGDRDRVVIGVAAEPRDAVDAFDVFLTGVLDPPRPWVGCADPYATARQLGHIVESRPAACVALVQVLRMGNGLSIPDRLILESLAYSTLQGGADFRAWLAAGPRRAHRPAETPVRLDRDGPGLSITLDRPWVRNAFDAATRDALCEALQVAVADPSISRVDLYGNGPAFCSGGDLAEFGTSRDAAQAHLVRVHRSPAALLHRCASRVTAHLHGACVGAGIELAAFAGRVVAAPDTVIRLPEIGMGLIPGAGGTASIPARVGRERTAYLALSGAELSVTKALRWGLVDEIGDLDDATTDAQQAFRC
ncbi:enoyl-CoA hydratase/isomerase family protein [Streptomyces sp. NBC_01239]|uniref:enoyl-CoA hydratase/isomerase family protein n=1 Tax=Streptomyces sp. NBC_01239 TaxID=2903792 RepID=UPI0022580B5A|nr:enoyl-CoA hydratase/isomerase family protein [Streptomyces sp. NBC_01239]MCX4816020.1 enoyl-CoA hydratase/isomerase family protein [Streptomyces sp. NBC_01239]